MQMSIVHNNSGNPKVSIVAYFSAKDGSLEGVRDAIGAKLLMSNGKPVSGLEEMADAARLFARGADRVRYDTRTYARQRFEASQGSPGEPHCVELEYVALKQ